MQAIASPSTDVGTPNIDRLLAAFAHEKLDRVPNFEILVDARSVSHVLGRETSDSLWQIDPRDAVRFAQAVGQDAVACSLTRTPDRLICSHDDADQAQMPDLHLGREQLQQYLAATAGTRVGVCARLSGPLSLTYNTTGPTRIEMIRDLEGRAPSRSSTSGRDGAWPSRATTIERKDG